MRDTARLAGFTEPVLIESPDAAECAAVAHYLHDTGKRVGRFRVASATHAPEQRTELSPPAQNGTLLLTEMDSLDDESRGACWRRLKTRLASVLSFSATTVSDALRERFRSFTLRLATLRERRLDLPLLVHYFTLQYNLRAGTHAYLTQTEVDD